MVKMPTRQKDKAHEEIQRITERNKMVKFSGIKKILIRYKVYFDRARMYVSYIQFGMLCVMFLKIMGIPCPAWSYPIWVITFVIICLLIGWIDCKLGIFQEEQKRVSEQNPTLTEILKKMEEIDRKLGNSVDK